MYFVRHDIEPEDNPIYGLHNRIEKCLPDSLYEYIQIITKMKFYMAVNTNNTCTSDLNLIKSEEKSITLKESHGISIANDSSEKEINGKDHCISFSKMVSNYFASCILT